VTTGHHTKTTVQPCIVMLHNSLLKPVLTTWKNPLLPAEKILPMPQLVCVQIRFSQTFCACPTIHQIYHFATPHLCGVVIQLFISDNGFQFSMD